MHHYSVYKVHKLYPFILPKELKKYVKKYFYMKNIYLYEEIFYALLFCIYLPYRIRTFSIALS